MGVAPSDVVRLSRPMAKPRKQTERLLLPLPPGTKERLDKVAGPGRKTVFIRDLVLRELDELERAEKLGGIDIDAGSGP